MTPKNRPILALLRFYKLAISPWLPQACRFTPTCSVYAAGCFAKFSFWRASGLTLKRLCRCHPFHAPGADPVPD